MTFISVSYYPLKSRIYTLAIHHKCYEQYYLLRSTDKKVTPIQVGA